MINQGPETYKVFLQGRDLVLTVEEIDKLNKEKRIKRDTRIYNNETKSWIDFKDYQRLHRILNFDSKKGPLIEKERLQTGTTYQVSLEGKYQTLTIYQVDKLLKEGRIKPDTRVYNNETGVWVNFKEYGSLYKSLMLFNTTKTYQSETERARVDTHYLQECSKCQHLYSKRAEKCPKCGNTVSATCNICKAEIPKSSSSCPECGDPEPFDQQECIKTSSTKSSSAPITVSDLGKEKGQVNYSLTSWKAMIAACILGSVLVVIVSDAANIKPPRIHFWTIAWIYLTIIAWKFWRWKALIPYPLYALITGVLTVLISDHFDAIWVLGLGNIGGLIIFYILLLKAQKARELEDNRDNKISTTDSAKINH